MGSLSKTLEAGSKKLSRIHSVAWHREAASSKKKAAEKYVGEFRVFVNAGSYLPQQVLNFDVTGLFFEKKMPNRSYITKEEKSMPGHKPTKDRITILVCANASGDWKIKPMVIFHSEKQKISKWNKVTSRKLPVTWQSNPKFWCTRQLLVEWVYETFVSQVKKIFNGIAAAIKMPSSNG